MASGIDLLLLCLCHLAKRNQTKFSPHIHLSCWEKPGAAGWTHCAPAERLIPAPGSDGNEHPRPPVMPTAPVEHGVVGPEQQSSEQGRESSWGRVLVLLNLLPAPFAPWHGGITMKPTLHGPVCCGHLPSSSSSPLTEANPTYAALDPSAQLQMGYTGMKSTGSLRQLYEIDLGFSCVCRFF